MFISGQKCLSSTAILRDYRNIVDIQVFQDQYIYIYIEEYAEDYCRMQLLYTGADKFLARPGRKQATATEDFDFHISYL